MIWKPRNYQVFSMQHIIKREVAPEFKGDWADANSGCLLDMGLGKTSTTLTAANELMYGLNEINRVLVVAPKRVAQDVWTDEIEQWDHLRNLSVSKILGTEKRRKEAVKARADIYITSRDLIVWLVAYLGGAWPYDMLVIDELSSFKNASSARFKALRKVVPQCKRVVGLTGTPAPNGLINLWPQMYLLDRGQRLGPTLTGYREAYFKEPYRHNNIPTDSYQLAGENPNDIEKNPNAKIIFSKLTDLCISMKAEDWLEMPKKIEIVTDIHLSPATLAQYKDFEKKQVLALADRDDLSVVSATAMSGKLLQFANGAVYVDSKHNFVEVHNEKIEALGERIEAADGNPVLVAYSFQSDVIRICNHLKYLKPKLLKTTGDMRDWNAGKIPFALAHPASFGHGLNLQFGGNLMEWFGLSWDLELYLQFVARLHRQGQQKSVVISRMKVLGTMDEKVIESLNNKESGQSAMMRALKAVIKQYV